MDKPTPIDRIQHVITSISKIRQYMVDATPGTFSTDDKLQSDVKYEFLVIGEAIKHIDQSILDKYEYPWHIPKSFRNFIVHAYHGIKLERGFYATQDLDDFQEVMALIIKHEF